MPDIHFAPIQGYTDHVYRKAHYELAGGISTYYSPFMRLEHGEVRRRDIRDISAENNSGVPMVPQIIAADAIELKQLTNVVRDSGYRRIDLNMGCPHPPQAGHGRGAGLLTRPDAVREIMAEIASTPDMKFSVKMRLGLESPDEWRQLVDILNDTPLEHVTLHARTARQMYRGVPDMDMFDAFLQQCRHRVIYNGGIKTLADFQNLEQRFPSLQAVMIGQGLMANPCFATECRQGRQFTQAESQKVIMAIHDRIFSHASATLQGDAQVLTHMQAFWRPLEDSIDRKLWKKLIKTSSLSKYREQF
ncbi:MAG: tRNA-dihydrouridine synthase family protein [Bacteroidaceae bacterium]|nr:tRNA-dihydrouridine synthase family protein [Bacteroidaceae bacterium]